MTPVKLTAELIEAFAGTYLAGGYDDASPTPQFHREGWALYCSDAVQAGIAAPRNHAKSTAFTHDFGLAAVLYRDVEYMVLVGATEEMGTEMLGDMARELRDNEDLIRDFGISKILTDTKTDIIVECTDGHQFRIIARGSGQKMRGRKWRGKRPGLVLCDDLEDDEQVESIDRRKKFQRWFYRALKPMLRRGGKIRIHGTILHEDSLLSKIIRDKVTWATLFYRAHEAFDDFSNILWPERFNEAALRALRQEFIEQFDAPGYSQEYLNDPFDNSDAYLRRDDFIESNEDEIDRPKRLCVGCDLAVSRADKANRTSFTVGGPCENNLLHIVEEYVGRWDSQQWVDMMFDIQKAYDPELWFVEDGVIWKTVEPMVNQEMIKRDLFLNIQLITSTKDKKTRGRSFQKRHRAKACRFQKDNDWYAAYEHELMRFTGDSDAVLDDQFDSTSILSIGIDKIALSSPEDHMDEDELYHRGHGPNRDDGAGRSAVTGY